MPTSLSRRILAWLPTLFFICYPLIVHVAVYLDHNLIVLQYLALACLLSAILLALGRMWIGTGVMLVVLFGLVYIWQQALTSWIIYSTPVIIFIGLAFFFGRTLLAGRTPLITNIATVMSPSGLHADETRYTRNITVVWTMFFCGMAVESILLALYAPLPVWSLMTNFVNYIIVACLFIIEYIVRKRLVTQDSYTSFFHFISVMLRKRHEIRQKLF